MSKKISPNPIKDLTIDWGRDETFNGYPFSGSEVQRFIKGHLTSITHYVKMFLDGSYLTIKGFRSKEEYEEYRDCDEALKEEAESRLVLWSDTMDISIDSTGKTSIGLINKGDATYNVITKKLTLKLRYTSVLKSDSGNGIVTSDSGEKGTLSIEKKVGSNWNLVHTITDIEPVAFSDNDAYVEVELSGDFITEGANMFHLTMTGQEYGVTSSPITINVNYSDVSLESATEWWSPFIGNTFTLSNFVHGTIDKNIVVTINGITKTDEDAISNNPISTGTAVGTPHSMIFNKSMFNLSHGTYYAEMHIKFKGSETTTEPIIVPIMVAEEGNNDILVAHSNVKPVVNNWSRATLMEFAVYNPTAASTRIYTDVQSVSTLASLYRTNGVYDNNTRYPFAFTLSLDLPTGETPIRVQFSDDPEMEDTLDTVNGINVSTVGNYGYVAGASLKVDPETAKIIEYHEGGNIDVTDSMLDTSGWTVNDGWREDENEIPVLRTRAGSKTRIKYSILDENTGVLNNQVEGSTTFDIAFKVSNIVDEDEHIIDISNEVGESFVGFRLYPLEAVMLSTSHPNRDTSNIPLREDTMQHLTISIVRDVRVTGFTKGVNIVRMYLNGDLRREYLYNKGTAQEYFVDIAQDAPFITIGSNSADIDIYGIRVYKGSRLSMSQCLQNYMASLPSIDNKIDFYARNQGILGSNEDIDRGLAEAAGFNTLTYIIEEGKELPSFSNKDDKTKIPKLINSRLHIDESWCANAKYISGMFYNMTIKGQGSTAKTYAEWNQQEGFASTDDGYAANGYFVNELNEDLGAGWYPDYNGDSSNKGIKVTKIVDKRNYASCMQSHKIGGTAAFNDLWQRVVGARQIGEDGEEFIIPGRRAVKEYPVLVFVQRGATTEFVGLGTVGSGKGDKQTFGMDTKKNPDFLMMEGSDNGKPLTMFQVPWTDDEVTYNTAEEGFFYNNEASWDFDMGAKDDTPDGGSRPKDGALISIERFKEFSNFVYQLNPFLKFLGVGKTLEYLNEHKDDKDSDDKAIYDRECQYYDSSLNVYRYDYVHNVFVNAGTTKSGSTWAPLNLVTQLDGFFDQDEYDSKSTWEARTAYFIKCRVAKYKAQLKLYAHVPDILYHQCFIRLVAGTDNRCKNTYFWILGKDKDGHGDNLIRLNQDDVDTIFRTDNVGLLTKLYWILEHDKRASNGANYWTSENNVFFTLNELAFEDDDPNAEYSLPKTMNSIFTAMAAISGSPDKFMDEYFFRVQKYFSPAAYNKTAEKLYEKYSILNQNGVTMYSSGVDPITQSLGSQLEGEQDYFDKRLPMLYGYCNYGIYAYGPDVSGALGFRSTIASATSVVYTLTPYQYIYPAINVGQGAKVFPNEFGGKPGRCEPGKEYTFTVDMQASTDTAVAICGINYLKSIGDFTNIPVTPEVDFTLNGKRLRDFLALGTANKFSPKSFSVGNSHNIETLNLNSVTSLNGEFDGSALTRLQTLNLSGTSYGQATLPETSSLISVQLPAIQQLVLGNQFNLETVQLDGYQNLTLVDADFSKRQQGSTQFLTDLLNNLMNYAVRLNVLRIKGWKPTEPLPNTNLINWLSKLRDCTIEKSAVNLGSKAITFEEKLNYSKWGNIDNPEGNFYIKYSIQPISSIKVLGKRINDFAGSVDYTLNAVGNNFVIPEEGDPITWSLDTVSCASITGTTKSSCTVTATGLDASQSPKNLRASMQLKFLTNVIEPYNIVTPLYFYPITPKIGDFAYANGDFSDKMWPGNTLSGVVYKIDDKGDYLDVYVWANQNAEVPISQFGTDGNTAALPWGIYKNGENDPSWPNAKLEQMLEVMTFNNGGTPVFNTTGELYNTVTGSYVGSPGFGSANSSNWLTSGYTIVDDDGHLQFKEAAAGTAIGDWAGKQKTRSMVNLANRIAKHLVVPCLQRAQVWTDPVKDNDAFDNVQELGKALYLWREMNDEDIWVNVGQGDQKRSDQCLYPAAYVCYLYTPPTKEWEIKHPQYEAKNWWLPSAAHECRVYWYLYLSQGKSTNVGTYTSIKDNYSTDTDNALNPDLSDAEIPIFSNIAKRYSDAGIEGFDGISLPASSYCWCSTETSSYASWHLRWNNGTLYSYINGNDKSYRNVTRAVVAFRYEKDRTKDGLYILSHGVV